MLSTDQMRAILERVTYKQGWRFSILDDSYQLHRLYMLVTCADAYHPGKTVDLGIKSVIPWVALRDRESFLAWVLQRIIEAEIHEAREFFKLDGVAWDDPHKEEKAA